MARSAHAWLLLLLCLALPRPVGAQSRAFPSSESLRRLQLQALSCARENTAATCSETRRQADPLMDHPLLPAACKDTVWAILQQAQPAASNSFERREGLAKLAQDVTVFCRQTLKPAQAKPAEATGGGAGGGGGGSFGFGNTNR